MVYQDEHLQDLREKVSRRYQLDRRIKELYAQQADLRRKVDELDNIRVQEQEDVDKLEGRSLAAFFYNVIGKMDQQLDKEREEAYAAAVKYDAALRELEDVEYDLRKTTAELDSLSRVENEYVRALDAKRAALKQANGAAGQQILKLEEELAALNSVKKELKEAIMAGNSALSAANAALDRLGKAGSLATWDMLGGGLLVDMAKHEALDEAQLEVEDLQNRLRRFRTELADVRLSADFHVNMEGFTRFADYFFDGLFMDWTVADQIGRSKDQVRQVARQLESAIARLVSMQDNTDSGIRQHRRDIDKLTLETKI